MVYVTNRWWLNYDLCLPPLQFLLFQPRALIPPEPFLPLRPPLSLMIREAVLSEISNPTVRQKENDEWYREKEMLRMAKRERSLPLSFLSRGTGQVPTSMYFTVWLGRHRVCWPVMHGVMSLCPCPHLLFYPAKLKITMMTMRKRRRRKRTVHLELGSAARDIDSFNGGMKLRCADIMRFPRAYLVIVVIGQILAVKSHPPPLKNTISAKRRRRDANSIHLAHST